MVGVARPAGHAGFFNLLITVQRSWIQLLGGDIRMAEHTAFSHRRCLPECGMADGTPAAQVGVGGNTPQGCTCLGVERARGEKHTATHQLHHNHDQDTQHGCDDAGYGQAAVRFPFHHSHRSTFTGTSWVNSTYDGRAGKEGHRLYVGSLPCFSSCVSQTLGLYPIIHHKLPQLCAGLQ
jgi:hypothetical protein